MGTGGEQASAEQCARCFCAWLCHSPIDYSSKRQPPRSVLAACISLANLHSSPPDQKFSSAQEHTASAVFSAASLAQHSTHTGWQAQQQTLLPLRSHIDCRRQHAG